MSDYSKGNRFGSIIARRKAQDYYEHQRNDTMERALQSPVGQLIMGSLNPPPMAEAICMQPFNDNIGRQHQCFEPPGHDGAHVCACGTKCTPRQQAHSLN